MVGPVQKQQVVAHIEKEHLVVSHARACRLLSFSRTKKYHCSKMEEKEKLIVEAIKQAVSNRRYGRKKVMAKVVKLHPDMSPFRIRRVYVKYGFSLPSKPAKRMRSVKANPICVPEKKNQSWHVDFMSDALVNGRKIRTFNAIDAYSRACIGIEIGFSMPSIRVTRILDQWMEKHGKPASIRSDNGPEFIAKHFKKWLSNNAIIWEQIQPGSPQENGIVERFNGTYRSEILDANLLRDLDHCKQITQDWIKEYNQERPHESLGFKTPMEYAA